MDRNVGKTSHPRCIWVHGLYVFSHIELVRLCCACAPTLQAVKTFADYLDSQIEDPSSPSFVGRPTVCKEKSRLELCRGLLTQSLACINLVAERRAGNNTMTRS